MINDCLLHLNSSRRKRLIGESRTYSCAPSQISRLTIVRLTNRFGLSVLVAALEARSGGPANP
jgi:hypothetical protein